MRILVIELGSKFTKCVCFRTDSYFHKGELTDLENYAVDYINLIETKSDKLLVLELLRVYNEIGEIDNTIIVTTKDSTTVNYYLEENSITKEKTLKEIKGKLVDKKNKKSNSVLNIELQNYSTEENYTDVLIHRLTEVDYNNVLNLIKELKIKNVVVYNGISSLKSIVPKKGRYIVYDIGQGDQTMVYYQDGIIKSVEKNDCVLTDIDKELMKNYSENEAYRIKHKSLIDLKATNPQVGTVLKMVNLKLMDFIKSNGLDYSIKLIPIGGYSNMKLEQDYFCLNKEENYFMDKRFKNYNNIPEHLKGYIMNSISAFLVYMEGNSEEIDFLNSRKDLAILSTKIDRFNVRSDVIQKIVITALLVNICFGIPIKYKLDKEFSNLISVNNSSLATARKDYEETKRKVDLHLNASGILSNSFKMRDLIDTISTTKPNDVNIEKVEYTNNNLVISVDTTNLEQGATFVKSFSDMFQKVEVQSPETLKQGTQPVFKLKVLCSEFKS